MAFGNKRVSLRALEPEDLELLYEWENNPDVWLVSGTFAPFSRYILKRYIEDSHLDIFQSKQLRLMIDVLNDKKQNTQTIGAIDLFDVDPYHARAGIGILIGDEAARNHGYASDALKILIDYSFQHLGLHQLYCNVAAENSVSMKLFLKSGFGIIGEKRDWLKTPNGWANEIMLQLVKD